jgi:transposase InsO family protein
MQLSALPRCFYRLRRLPSLFPDAQRRWRWMEHYFARGRNAALTCRHFDIPRSTFFYWLSRFNPRDLSSLEDRSRRPKRTRSSPLPPAAVDKVVALREKHPAWSKYKLAVVLERDHGIRLSPSTLGRIFKKRNLFLPKVRAKGLRRLQRKRERPDKALRSAFPGSLVQTDTKHLRFSDGQKVYQFTAIDTCTRLRVLRTFSTASSKSAERFLDEIRKSFPFPVKTIQSDNGSEFLDFFDKACVKEKHVFSHPRTPKDNAFVERSHRTDDEEFYHLLEEEPENVEDLKQKMRAWEKTYNTLRPHASLNYLTPAAYLANLSSGDPKRRRMSNM